MGCAQRSILLTVNKFAVSKFKKDLRVTALSLPDIGMRGYYFIFHNPLLKPGFSQFIGEKAFEIHNLSRHL